MLHSATSVVGLHFSLRPIYPNTLNEFSINKTLDKHFCLQNLWYCVFLQENKWHAKEEKGAYPIYKQ